MKLRNIILSAIALALTASFTACDKDDDDKQPEEENINIYQAWNYDEFKKSESLQNIYYVFSKDSLNMYCRPTEASAKSKGLSADTAYFEQGLELTSTAVTCPDSATVTGQQGDKKYTFVVKKTAESKYLLIWTYSGKRDSFSVTPAGNINLGYYKDDDD